MYARTQRRLDPFLFVFLLMLVWHFGAMARAQSQTPPGAGVNPALRQETTVAKTATDLSKKHVLLLHAYTYEAASSVVMDPIFLKGFVDAGLDANQPPF